MHDLQIISQLLCVLYSMRSECKKMTQKDPLALHAQPLEFPTFFWDFMLFYDATIL